MDRIFIRNLSVDTIIGIFEHERVTPQRITLHLEMSADVASAAASEQIDSTLCYKTLSETIVQFVQQSQLKLTLHKPDALPDDIDVGVIIERGSAVARGSSLDHSSPSQSS